MIKFAVTFDNDIKIVSYEHSTFSHRAMMMMIMQRWMVLTSPLLQFRSRNPLMSFDNQLSRSKTSLASFPLYVNDIIWWYSVLWQKALVSLITITFHKTSKSEETQVNNSWRDKKRQPSFFALPARSLFVISAWKFDF